MEFRMREKRNTDMLNKTWKESMAGNWMKWNDLIEKKRETETETHMNQRTVF